MTSNPLVDDFNELPSDLPVPQDDGAADRLRGLRLPSVPLMSTSGEVIDLAALPRTTVVYAYPRTGRPEEGVPEGWNAIPGARGCTPQSCAFRDLYGELQSLGARVFGLSTQDTEYQREVVTRLHLPFPLLSDERLELTRTMRLPTFVFRGAALLKRLTLILENGRIEKAFYPVFPPDANAAEVVQYLRARDAGQLVP